MRCTPLGSGITPPNTPWQVDRTAERLELGPFNIDVVIIEPGVIATEFADVMVAPMIMRSGDGPYIRMTRAVATTTQ